MVDQEKMNELVDELMNTDLKNGDFIKKAKAEKVSPPLMSPLKKSDSHHVPIYKIVLTGGPCAGKTTALDRLSTYFRDRGFRVYMVPEAATLLRTGGVTFPGLDNARHVINFQWQILSMQMKLEDSFYALAKDTGVPSLILCDRGAMDGSAYMSPDDWDLMLDEHDLDTVNLREGRYIAVFHLVTAADGAEKYYTLDNNLARHESVDEAVELDKMTCNAWIGHPKLYIFDNSTDFEGKMQRLVDTASTLCGLPSTVKATRKFLLKSAPVDIPIFYETFEVEKVYLNPEASENAKDYSFVRCRSQHGISAYGMTTVRYLSDGERVDLKRILTSREFSYAVRHRKDPNREVVKQDRICFLYKGQSFQIHIYKEPKEKSGLAICHVQASSVPGYKLLLPSFLDIEKELSPNDSEHSAYNVCMKSKN